jgi:hypothetical protein
MWVMAALLKRRRMLLGLDPPLAVQLASASQKRVSGIERPADQEDRLASGSSGRGGLHRLRRLTVFNPARAGGS